MNIEPGDVVRQQIHRGGRYDYATVNRVYDWGGLDVLMGGKLYGWSAGHCELVRKRTGEYLLNQPRSKA